VPMAAYNTRQSALTQTTVTATTSSARDRASLAILTGWVT